MKLKNALVHQAGFTEPEMSRNSFHGHQGIY